MDDLNLNSELSKGLLYIYTTETFLPFTMNKAIREKNVKKIDTLGPFAFLIQKLFDEN